MKRLARILWAGVLIVSTGLVGCTRAKPEVVTPTVVGATATLVAAAGTTEPTAPVPTETPVFTPEAPPTGVPLTSEPTVISVEQATPTSPSLPSATPVSPTPAAGQFDYTVQWGDTLFSLAQRFNTTVDAIVALNNLQNASYISVGQVLKITGTAGQPPEPGQEYVVQPGDTLFSIARRFGTTVAAIQHANGIVNAWYIRVGQELVIPQGTSPPSPGGNTYVVLPGDTLYSIAARFGKSVWDLVVANNLSNPSLIVVGQVLTIPS
jgi:LysM repeat protein